MEIEGGRRRVGVRGDRIADVNEDPLLIDVPDLVAGDRDDRHGVVVDLDGDPVQIARTGVLTAVADRVVGDRPGQVGVRGRRRPGQDLDAVHLGAEGGIAVDVECRVGILGDADRDRDVV